VRTPTPFELPKKSKRVKIVLKLAGYDDLVVPPFAVTDNVSDEYKLVKKKVYTPPGTGRGSGSGKTPGQGSGSNDTGLMRPE
jgi:hypothetical protein